MGSQALEVLGHFQIQVIRENDFAASWNFVARDARRPRAAIV